MCNLRIVFEQNAWTLVSTRFTQVFKSLELLAIPCRILSGLRSQFWSQKAKANGFYVPVNRRRVQGFDVAKLQRRAVMEGEMWTFMKDGTRNE
jgi:hypothetical protein